MTKEELAAIKNRTSKADQYIRSIESLDTTIKGVLGSEHELVICVSGEVSLCRSVQRLQGTTIGTGRLTAKDLRKHIAEFLTSHQRQLERELSEL